MAARRKSNGLRMDGLPPQENIPSIRVDKWLWYARFLKTRSLASKFVDGGKIRRRRDPSPDDEAVRLTKANQTVNPGDILTFVLGARVRVVKVLEIGQRRGPAAEARLLYEDLSPPPPPRDTPQEGAAQTGPSAGRRPTKKERRALTKLKEEQP